METTWKVAQMKRDPLDGVVIEVTYIMNFKLQGETDRKVGIVVLVGDSSDPDFIPYDDLTEQIVLNWVQNELGSATITSINSQYETKLQQKINEKNNPNYLIGLPW